MIAEKLKKGDEIRIIAPSSSLTRVRTDIFDSAVRFLNEMGFRVTFSANCRECDRFLSSAVQSRVNDLHDAFRDPQVKAVMACIGGFSCNEILPYLDDTLIQANPKILCGYSDITALLNAVYAKTGMMTYHTPHFAALGFTQEREYTKEYFTRCLMQDVPFTVTASETAKRFTVLQDGACEGVIIGGNLCTLNLLQGTPYMPDLHEKVLFLEDDNIMGDYFVPEFCRNLQSLLQVPGAETVRGIVFGRFADSCNMTEENVRAIIKGKIPAHIPVISDVDFGHVFPMISFPVGGTVQISAADGKADMQILAH